MALLAGSNLGPYRIMESVGRGGMASVFKAYEASLDRYVALKVLPPEFLHDPTFAERFRREAQTVARLEHPQIIPIFAYDIDTATGTPWMAMRLISGGSLSQRIKRGRMAPTESARILKDVADALDYAHSQGVIHRDVKPQNVLLDDAGRVYLADFGIAKMVESSAHLTQTGMITGTPQYMAPEQALGKSIDKSIDIYALGIVAYELFTGRVPFSADTPIAVLMKQASEPMPLPSVNEVQEEVTRAILRATAKDPVARWPTATAFAKAVSDATISVGSTMATSAMPSLSAETVQGMTAPSMTAGTKKLDPAAMMAAPRPAAGSQAARVGEPIPVKRGGGGSGLAIAAFVILVLGVMGAGATYVGYRYWQSKQAIDVVADVPSPTPLADVRATPEPVAPMNVATPLPEATPEVPVATPPPTRDPTPDPMPVKKPTSKPRSTMPADAGDNGPVSTPAPQRSARTRINLEVEASQPSTGAQISVLYAQVLIDNRPFRDFPIRFTGGNSFARWKKIENIVLDDVPLSAKEITLAVGTDPGANDERMEASTRLALQGEETSLNAVVRFYNQYDKSVKFR